MASCLTPLSLCPPTTMAYPRQLRAQIHPSSKCFLVWFFRHLCRKLWYRRRSALPPAATDRSGVTWENLGTFADTGLLTETAATELAFFRAGLALSAGLTEGPWGPLFRTDSCQLLG